MKVKKEKKNIDIDRGGNLHWGLMGKEIAAWTLFKKQGPKAIITSMPVHVVIW